MRRAQLHLAGRFFPKNEIGRKSMCVISYKNNNKVSLPKIQFILQKLNC